VPKIKKKLKPLKNCNIKAQAYCFKKGLEIYPVLYGSKYKVWYGIGKQGKYYMQGKEFVLQEAYQSIWDLYQKIYDYDNK
jgi:hypothetical protein